MRYFLVDDDPDLRYDDEDELIDYCVSADYFADDTEGFDEWLDMDGRIDINGHSFMPSEILYAVDPDGYNEDKQSWAEDRAESERENARYEARHTRPGSSFYICGYDIYVYEEDDEPDESDDSDNIEDTISVINKQIEEAESRRREDQQREDAFESLFQCL